MQECHDNESHNHNEHLLLYKEAEIFLSILGRFLECRGGYDAGAHALSDMYALALGHCVLSGIMYVAIYIRQGTLACVITYTYPWPQHSSRALILQPVAMVTMLLSFSFIHSMLQRVYHIAGFICEDQIFVNFARNHKLAN